jgi:hypothetical protein
MIRLACIQLYIDSIVVRKGSDRARFEQIVWRASLCRAPMPITTAQYAYPRYLVHQLNPKVPSKDLPKCIVRPKLKLPGILFW